jgi:hypothetical protein
MKTSAQTKCDSRFTESPVAFGSTPLTGNLTNRLRLIPILRHFRVKRAAEIPKVTALWSVNPARHVSFRSRRVYWTDKYVRSSAKGNGKWNCDLEQSPGPTAPIEMDLPAVILDNFFHYRETKPTAFCLSEAHEWLKNIILHLWVDAGAVIPDPNLQVCVISHCGYNNQSSIRRYCLASIQDEVGDHLFETVGIEPAHSRTPMMVLDRNSPELRFHSDHPDRALDCVDDVSGGWPKIVAFPRGLRQ